MSITAEILKVLTKSGSTSVAKESGMTVGDVRTKLGIPESQEAMSGDRRVGENDLVSDMSRLAFSRGSANNSDVKLSIQTNEELVNNINVAIGQANIAAGVYKAECSKDKKVNPMCELANRLNADQIITSEDAIATLESLPARLAPSLYELVLRSSEDEKLAKTLGAMSKKIATLAGRSKAYSQV